MHRLNLLYFTILENLALQKAVHIEGPQYKFKKKEIPSKFSSKHPPKSDPNGEMSSNKIGTARLFSFSTLANVNLRGTTSRHMHTIEVRTTASGRDERAPPVNVYKAGPSIQQA